MSIYLIQQTGQPRVTFGVSLDVPAELSSLAVEAGSLELLHTLTFRSPKVALRVQRLLHRHYRVYQDGVWYCLPAAEVDNLKFWFEVLSTVLSGSKPSRYNKDLPGKKYPHGQFLRAVNWLREHDPDGQLSCRTVAAQIGVSHGTVYNAARYLLSLKESE